MDTWTCPNLELTVTVSFAHLPLSFLHAELQRRQAAGERPACGSHSDRQTPNAGGGAGSGAAGGREYNFALHLGALFLILTLSTLACSFPLIIRRFPRLPVPNHALFISRHFGTGVLIATAFVHLFPTAYTNLLDPCLPPFWTHVYPAMPGFVAMVSVMVVVGLEMFFAMKGAAHSHHLDFEQLKPGRPLRSAELGQNQRPVSAAVGDQPSPYLDAPPTPTSSSDSPAINKPLPRTPSPGGQAHADEDDDDHLDLDDFDPVAPDTQPLTHSHSHSHSLHSDDEHDAPFTRHANGHARPAKHSRQVSWADQAPEQDTSPHASTPHEQRLVLQCLMLEAGILFHSVFIGLALSVSTGPSFVVLLVAISFHQTFEGLALGSRIASIASFSTTSYKPWLMSLMYGITTPIGQAIGLGVQGLYDPQSQFGLLMVGIMNAISSGLLLYAGLVQLLAEDFLSDASYMELRGRRRLQACGAVIAGAMLMALVGVWA